VASASGAVARRCCWRRTAATCPPALRRWRRCRAWATRPRRSCWRSPSGCPHSRWTRTSTGARPDPALTPRPDPAVTPWPDPARPCPGNTCPDAARAARACPDAQAVHARQGPGPASSSFPAWHGSLAAPSHVVMATPHAVKAVGAEQQSVLDSPVGRGAAVAPAAGPGRRRVTARDARDARARVRLAQRWGLTSGRTVEQTEADLKLLWPEARTPPEAHAPEAALRRRAPGVPLRGAQCAVSCLLGARAARCAAARERAHAPRHAACARPVVHCCRGLGRGGQG